MSDWDEEDEEPCCEDYEPYGSSHYHCANCGEVSSMLGHWSQIQGKFTCEV